MVFCPEIPKEESRNYFDLDSWDFESSYLFAQISDWGEVLSKLVAFVESFSMVCRTLSAHTEVGSIPNF